MDWLRLVLVLLSSGQGMYYAPGMFREPIAHRLAWGQITQAQVAGHVGYVALRTPEWIGRTVWISRGEEWYGPLLVVDVANPADYPALDARGWVVDVDFATARRMGMLGGPLPVMVWEQKEEIWPWLLWPSTTPRRMGVPP